MGYFLKNFLLKNVFDIELDGYYEFTSISKFKANSISYFNGEIFNNESISFLNVNNSVLIVNDKYWVGQYFNYPTTIIAVNNPKKLYFTLLKESLKGIEINNKQYIDEILNSKVAKTAKVFNPFTCGSNLCVEHYSIIGQEGWSSYTDEAGKFIQIPHIGGVIIGNDVSIGSYVTIDRGTLDDTIIGDNVRINDRVHIAHNVEIGNNVKIGANCCISGGTLIGNNCYISPGVVFSGHNKICDGCFIGTGTVVFKDIEEPGTYVNDIGLVNQILDKHKP